MASYYYNYIYWDVGEKTKDCEAGILKNKMVW